MQPRDLIASARRLLGRGQKSNPRQSDLKRAMSTAYYAMFHALCRNCADSLIGKTRDSRSQPAWVQAYRAVNHGFAKNKCKEQGVMERFPRDIQDFSNQFVILQAKRHDADYDPSSTFTRHDVLTSIDAAAIAIKKLQASNVKDRRAFAVWTVMNKRSD